MISTCVALVALTDRVHFEDVARVTAALQIQVTRDFAPVWGASAVIVAASPEAIPSGYCPIFIHGLSGAEGADGFHRTRSDDSPYVLVPYGPNWSLAAGHELLRLLANPTGSARAPGLSCMPGQAVVEYLLDVCAPCQAIALAYAIEGVVVPEFWTPSFYTERAAGPYSFTGALERPLRPAHGGVVTWLADDGLFYQSHGAPGRDPRVHGGFSGANRAGLLMREFVDRQMPDRLRKLANAATPPRLIEAEQNAKRSRLTNFMRFRDDIDSRFGHFGTDAEPLDTTVESTSRRRGYAGLSVVQQPEREPLRTTASTAS